MLRLNESLIRDPRLRAIATHHRAEDRGHDRWFLKDLETFRCTPDIDWLFGSHVATTRDTAYELIAESYRATHDIARIVLVLALEASAECLFSRAPSYIERTGYDGPIQYFSTMHQDAEKDHELHEEGFLKDLANLSLSPAERDEAVTVVHRTFDSLTRMYDFFEANIESRRDHVIRQARVRRGHLDAAHEAL